MASEVVVSPGKGVMPDGTSRFADSEGKPIWCLIRPCW